MSPSSTFACTFAFASGRKTRKYKTIVIIKRPGTKKLNKHHVPKLLPLASAALAILTGHTINHAKKTARNGAPKTMSRMLSNFQLPAGLRALFPP